MRKFTCTRGEDFTTIEISGNAGRIVTISYIIFVLMWSLVQLLLFIEMPKVGDVIIILILFELFCLFAGYIIIGNFLGHLFGVEKLYLSKDTLCLEKRAPFFKNKKYSIDRITINNIRILPVKWGKGGSMTSYVLIFDSENKSHSIGIGLSKTDLDSISYLIKKSHI